MTFKQLTVYKKAYELAMEIFEESKRFPPEEKYSLTSQIRRSSRSVCSSIAEGYRKRNYEAHFVSKEQTQTWKIVKRWFGLISHYHASTYLAISTQNGIKQLKKLANY